MIKPTKEIRSEEWREHQLGIGREFYKKRATKLILGGIAASAALGVTLSEVNIDPGAENIILGLETLGVFGGFLLGSINAIKAREMHSLQLGSIDRLNHLKFGMPENP